MASYTHLKVVCKNIAASKYDEIYNPFWSRLPILIDELKEAKPDILLLLEAGRESDGHGWKEITEIISKELNLSYQGILKKGIAERAHGQAIFVSPSTKLISFHSIWISLDSNKEPIPIDDGLMIARATVKHISYPECFRIAFVHFPKDDRRLTMIHWLAKNKHKFQVVMGDFNTFPDNKGPEMIKFLNTEMIPLLDQNVITFKGFENDKIKVKNENLHLFAQARITEKGEVETTIIPAAKLDHIYITDPTLNCAGYCGPITKASDHCSLYLVLNIHVYSDS